MAAEDVQANVVLTADTGAYDQSMQASASHTENLAASVDSLGKKLNDLAKSSGRKLVGIAAADVAIITGATAAYAAFEKQMESLSSQAAMLHKEEATASKVFKEQVRDVNDLRRTYGETTRDAAALVQTISKMADSTAPVQKLQSSFSKLGAAVGESPVALANGMLQLQKTMGTSQRDTDKFNNQLATLQSRSNSSASAILEFSNSIAPVGRMVNMTQTDIMGFSNAFIKAGQDGYQAANVFNKMLSNIAYATQSGSPELAKYANLVGMTTENFQKLGGTDQYLKIFDAINRQGPQAITTLNRMGLDGMRTVRTVTAMAQQGGMGAEIAAARSADPNNMQRGYKAATDGIVDSLKKLRAELATTAESFGARFAKPAEGVINVLTGIAKAGRVLMDSPIGKLAAWAAGIAAPFAAMAGSILLASKALMAFSAARMALTGATATGFQTVRGMDDTQRAAMAASNTVPGFGRGRDLPMMGGVVGQRGGQVAQGSWLQRAMFNRGADAARGLGFGSDRQSSFMRNATSRLIGYGATGAAMGVNTLLTPQWAAGAVRMPGMPETGGYSDLNRRQRLFTSPTFAGSMGMASGGFWARQADAFRAGRIQSDVVKSGAGFLDRAGRLIHRDDASLQNEAMKQSEGKGVPMSKRIADAEKFVQRTSETAQATEKLTKATSDMGKQSMTASTGLGRLTRSMGGLMGTMAGAGVGAARFGGGLLGRGAAAIGMNPWMLGIMGGAAGISYINSRNKANEYRYEDMSGGLKPYYEAGGIAAPTGANYSYGSQADQSQMTLASAYRIDPAEGAAARDSSHKLTNTQLRGMDKEEAEAFLSTQWATLGKNPQAVHAVALDLTDKFGAAGASSILNNLRSGNARGIGTFTGSAADQAKSRWWNNAGKGTTKDLNRFFGALSAQTDQLAMTKGLDSAMSTRGSTLDSAISDVLKGGGKWGTNEEQLDKALARNLFGIENLEEGGAWWDPLGGFGTKRRSGAAGNLGRQAPDTLKEYLRYSFDEGSMYEPGTEARKQALSRLDITETKGLSNREVADLVYKAITEPPQTEEEKQKEESAAGQIEKATSKLFGTSGILGLSTVKTALAQEGNVNAQYAAINEVTRTMRGSGLSTGGQIKQLMNVNALASGDEALGATYVNAAIQQIQQRQAMRAPYQSRTQQFSEQADIFGGIMGADLGPEGMAQREAAGQTFAAQVQEQYNYFKQQLYQQREFNVMRARAEEDFNLQRQYAQTDFELSRRRALQDYQIQRERAEQDFARSMRRNREDFQLSRRRQEADHHHQVMLMIEAQAKAMYNMYERVKVQRTDSAQWILQNSIDQTRRMQEQAANLDKLRSMGLKDNVIQQMGLTDPQNAQQLARFVAEIGNDPDLVRQFNKQVGQRLKAARKVVTDESSTDWQEFERSFKLARSRAQDDFERQMGRARADFRRGLSQQDEDFQRSLSRQQKDFATSMGRQEEAFEKSMNRSAEDLARAAKTIDGNFEDILEKAVKNLGGHARTQAKTVLQEFRDLRTSIAPSAIATMELLADIFGVEYTPPKRAATKLGQSRAPKNREGRAVAGKIAKAAGGVLPGWSPGVDVHRFHSDTAGELQLSGGEAIMVPEWTKAVGGPDAVARMNKAARETRSFKGGGVTPAPGSWNQHTSGYPWARWSGDINVPGSGDYGNPVKAWKDGIVSAVKHLTTSYGQHIRINHPGSNEQTLYAHLSKTRVSPGDRVTAGQLIGNVGSTGNSSGPHLHFEIKGGTGPIDTTGSAGAALSFADAIKEIYPRAERAVNRLSQVQPFAEGDMSEIINRFAKLKWDKMVKKYGAPGASENAGWEGIAPSGSGTNQEIVREAMQNFGWNQWGSLYKLVMKESGFNNTAQNPTSTAYGMFQFLDSTWAGVGGKKTSDPALQALYGMRYIKNRYGSPARALAFHNDNNWYADGAMFQGPQTIGVGERGPEAVIPLNERGTDFMLGLMKKLNPGMEAKQSNVRGSSPVSNGATSYSYSIDRSTTFSGPITVTANNPGELIHQLQARQRVMALSQPVLNGARG